MEEALTKSDPAEESIDRYSKVLAYLFRVIPLATRINPRSQRPLVRSKLPFLFDRSKLAASNVYRVTYQTSPLSFTRERRYVHRNQRERNRITYHNYGNER